MNKLVWACAALLIAQFSQAQQVSVDKLKDHVYTLAGDKFDGRRTGTRDERKAAKYICKQVERAGLKKVGDNRFFQDFEFQLKLVNPENPHGEMVDKGMIEGRNVVAWVDNAAQHTIIIGAHYDHLGEGAEFGGSREANPEEKIHYGADDNASGVASLIEMARYLENNDKIEEHNYLFIFFSGEEQGLHGSKYYAANPTVDLGMVSYMINLDMVGRLDSLTRKLVIHGVGSSPVFGDNLNAVNKDDLSLVFDSSGVGPSDFTSFYRKDIPVLGFFTGQHKDYHKSSDTPDKLNYGGQKQVTEFILRLMDRLDTIPKLDFTKTKEPQMGRSRFKVTMGIMPDYTFSGPGLRVDGVTDDKPASKAGVKAGDVILKIGEDEIKDMGAYMKFLAKTKEGTETTVTVLRGDIEITLPIKF